MYNFTCYFKLDHIFSIQAHMKNHLNLFTLLTALFLSTFGYGQNTGCPVPVAQTATNITSTSASINWSVFSSTLNPSMVMRYRVVNTATWISGTPSSKPVVLNNLTPSTTYEWQIAQVCTTSTGTAVTSAYSNLIIFTTTGQNTTCTPPTGLLTDSITSSTARLSWAPVSGAAGYNIRYRVSGSSTWASAPTQGNARVLFNLLAATSYEWQVQTVCSSAPGTINNSTFSPSQTFTTLASAPCNTPTGMQTDSITATSAKVSWTPVTGAFGYNVRFRISGATLWTTVGSPGNARILNNLLPASNYEWQVQTHCGAATNPGSASAFSASQFFTTLAATVCPVPAGLQSDSITTSSARVFWTAVTGAQAYNVRYRPSTTTTWISVTSTTISRKLINLSPSTNYEWQVQSICSPTTVSGGSAWSTSATFTTLSAPTCPVPAGLQSDSITTSSARVFWTAVSGAQAYNVRYRSASSTTWITVASTTTSRKLINLAPSTTYEWQAQSICSPNTTSGASLWSSSASFTTLSAPLCPVPGGLQSDSITATSARVYWTAVVGVQGYNVRYRRVTSTTTSSWVTVISTTPSRRLTSLLSSSNYEWQVQSVCSPNTTSGVSAWSSSAFFTTLSAPICPVPSGLQSDSITASSARVYWTAVSGVQGYYIRYRPVTNTIVNWMTVTSTTPSRRLTNLLPSTNYEWQVQSVCSPATAAGGSVWSASANFTTVASTPCNPPTGLVADSITNSSARLSWTPVAGAVGYQLSYRASGAAIWNSSTLFPTVRTITGLQAGTTYEAQVRSVCSSTSNTNATSIWTPAITFTTLAPAMRVPDVLNNRVNIRRDETMTGEATYRLFDSAGKIVDIKNNTSAGGLDLSELTNGTYYLETRIGNRTERTQLEVNR